jgi:aminoglycoside phosphotransferase (APT) family kinase protein
MLLPADRLMGAVNREFARLREHLGDSGTDASALQAISNGLALVSNRATGDVTAVQAQLGALIVVLQHLREMLPSSETDLQVALDDLLTDASPRDPAMPLPAMEELWRRLLSQLQSLIAKINRSSATDDAKASIVRALVSWESSDLLLQAAAPSKATSDSSVVEINHESLTRYLRDRFNESALEVTSLQPLAGGFGKQTILFEVSSKAISGAFVMRRDLGANAGLDNDCHLIRHEYPVIRAAFARHFPAPEALWLDTDHGLLPGGDFIVMRRSPGTQGGNFFGASAKIPDNLAGRLADIAARLHGLPALTELGELTDSISPSLWNLSREECTARYINGWYQFYLNELHTPSPALVGLYGWLFDNMPHRPGRPVLLHGDLGFHNFLFKDNELTAVLDWEFAHVGDPAEDLGYVKVTVGAALDWDLLMARYQAAGGDNIDRQTLRFFQVWAYVRNVSAGNILSTRFASGRVDDLKLAFLPHGHIPHFLRGAQALIDSPVG